MTSPRAHRPVDPEITVEELVTLVPRAAALLRRHGIVCIQCGEPVWGTLRELAAEKGITDLEPILSELRAEAANGDDAALAAPGVPHDQAR